MNSNENSKRVHHATFYLPFGDLVVQSTTDTDGVSTLFRVNKSVLAYNSSVFAGMFALPGSGSVDAQDVYDGVPIVRLSDPVDELAALFSVLHNPSSLSLPRFDPDVPILLTGIMRLATKYQFDSIRTRIVEIMHESWPQSFEQWLRFRSELAVIKKAHAKAADGLVNDKSFEERIPEPAAAIRFARDFEVPSILPLAFYTLAGISHDKDWDELREPKNLAMREAFTKEQTCTARWRLLCLADYQCVMKCREHIAHEVYQCAHEYRDPDYIRDYTFAAYTPCKEFQCDAKTRSLRGSLKACEDGILGEAMMVLELSLPDPLRLLEKLADEFTASGICGPCQVSLLDSLEDTKRTIWDSMSSTVSMYL